ncbi:MAG: hypothetical protein K2M98_05015 [Muribaculum sp.]|nr:hypothetical protein [Muribaculum sp.]
MAEDNMMFDEQQAVKFIKNYMPADIAQLYSGDEILNIIDMIWDFYEDNGLLEIQSDDDDTTLDKEKLLDYVNKMLKKDKLAVVDKDHVKYIVDGELAYERSIGLEE